MLADDTITCEDAMRLAESEDTLSLEKFLIAQNNFHLHFAKNFIGDAYRTQEPYEKALKNSIDFCNISYYLMFVDSSDVPLLYKAYKIMRPFAATNWEMFM